MTDIKFTSELRRIHFEEIKNVTNDPNEIWLFGKLSILNYFNNRHASLLDMEIKGNNLPYIAMEVRQIIRQRDYLTKRQIKKDLQSYSRLFNKLETK